MDPTEQKKGFFQRLLAELTGAKPEAPAKALPYSYGPKPHGPEYRPLDMGHIDAFKQRQKMAERLAKADSTDFFDPNRKDEFGRTLPTNNDRQYTMKGLQQLRKTDPEWPDERRWLSQQAREETEGYDALLLPPDEDEET